ncbi:MAG: hypothetical protein IJZ30_04700 [Alphaproteobacteria bacterium]|nr:hypothetical protein [Alphaproteobacteria bacterium]
MENLNDVEFGSDKDKEEAPILVAQRYLNIYRQIHIFNKEKRDQFDDELLALPANIFDFFKRMPGGRLLVEHIEEVKTERGISFVKSSKEDFAEGSGTSTTPTPAPVVAGGVAPIVGGSVTVDESFAEALAQSMANAFKQNPMQATVSGGGAVGGKIDFGNAFDIIAEEIKTSRTSLLDVLKETRSITDSVIASQVSISRILEGILSARTRDEVGTADLNNRIIASQASITKLLEGLYLANNQKNNEISDYLNIETKLQNFKNEIRAEMEQSLVKMQDMFVECMKSFNDKKVVIETKEPSLKHDDIKNLSTLLASTIKEHANIEKKENFETNNNTTPQRIENNFAQDTIVNENDINRKKKNKKKNKNNQFNNFESEDNVNNENKQGGVAEKVTMNTVSAPIVDGVIRNNTFKHEDNFNNVKLDTPPMDDLEDEIEEEITTDEEIDINFDDLSDLSSISDLDLEDVSSVNDENKNLSNSSVILDDTEIDIAEENDDNFTSLDGIVDDDLSFELPEQNTEFSADDNTTEENESFTSLDDIVDDGLSFELPEQNTEFNTEDSTIEEGESFSSLDDIADDGLSFELPEQNTEFSAKDNTTEESESFSSLDDIADDGLSFELPEQNTEFSAEDNTTEKSESFTSLDDIADDGLSFELPEQNTEFSAEDNIAEKSESFSSLDDIADDGLSFELPEENTEFSAEDNTTKESESFSSLDDIADDGLSFELPEENKEENKNTENSQSDNVSIDDFFNTDAVDNTPQAPSQPSTSTSRYSAELDKIRAALTSDNVDISSLDEPIALDDYSDDENVPQDDEYIGNTSTDADEDWEYEYVEDGTETLDTNNQTSDNNEEWDWEYVDENGNPIESNGEDEEWEWEYVEEEEASGNNVDNNNQ